MYRNILPCEKNLAALRIFDSSMERLVLLKMMHTVPAVSEAFSLTNDAKMGKDAAILLLVPSSGLQLRLLRCEHAATLGHTSHVTQTHGRSCLPARATNLREVSLCLEKAPIRAFSMLKLTLCLKGV